MSVACAAACVLPLSAVAAERTFFTGSAGSLPPSDADRAGNYFRMAEVRRLLEQLENGPVPERDAASILVGSGATIDDLIRTRIVRRSGHSLLIGFNYFTLTDMRRIHATAERHVPSLVAAYLAHTNEFDEILRSYPVPSVDRKRLATVLIAGFALNWDALDMTARSGLRRPELVTGPNWRYSFFASEADPDYSQHGFIWGSSSILGIRDNFEDNPVDFTFSSFGDPYSDPRVNFPDVFYLPMDSLPGDVRAAIIATGTRNETYAGISFKNVLGVSRARSLGPMLFALRHGPKSADDLRNLVDPADQSRADSLIQLLIALDYIGKNEDGRYELYVPVFDSSDAPMVHAALSLHRRIFADWLAQIYPSAKNELSSITAVRQGVPFESAFTQIWHEYFGLATRQLVEQGFMADPYDPAMRHKGSISVLWRQSIYHFDPG